MDETEDKIVESIKKISDDTVKYLKQQWWGLYNEYDVKTAASIQMTSLSQVFAYAIAQNYKEEDFDEALKHLKTIIVEYSKGEQNVNKT